MDHTSSSCASSRADAFPAGLRVLVVDDDPTWLKILEKMLRKCSYEVTTCCLARVALDMLRERRDRFDIVISDVNMPDMDGFKLLEHVGLEMDLPVIMMSVDGETSRVMKGVQHGACDYLLKPVRMKELRNIWQHVFRKKIHEIKEVESQDGSEEFQFLKGRFEEFDERNMLYGSDFGTTRKRKEMDYRERFDPDFVDPSSVKKARVVWTVDLHQKFVNAVNQIGFEKVGPKKILDLMNIPGLTRENVASHLQKYRLYLSRLQKQNEGTQAGGAMQLEAGSGSGSGSGSKEAVGKFSTKSAKTSTRNSSSSENCGLPGVQNRIPEACRDELKGVVIQSEDPGPRKAKTILQPGVMTPTPPNHDYWNKGISPLWFTQYPRQDQEPFSYHQHQHQHPSHNLGDSHLSKPVPAHANTSFSDQNESGSFQIKPECADYGSKHAINLDNDLVVSVQVGNRVQDSRHLGAPSENNRSSDIKDQYAADQRLFESLESPQQKSNLGDGLVLSSSSPEDLLCSLQGYSCFENLGPSGAEIHNYNNLNQLTDFQSNLYDGLQLDCEYLFELMKYSTTGGDLFA